MSDEYLNGQSPLPEETEYDELSVDELIASAKADLDSDSEIAEEDIFTPEGSDASAYFSAPEDLLSPEAQEDSFWSVPGEFPAVPKEISDTPEEYFDEPVEDLDATRKVAGFDPVTGMPLLEKSEPSFRTSEDLPKQEPAPAPQTLPEQDGFEPDFGTAFDDYGEYSEPESTEPEIAPEEPPVKIKSKRHRIPTLVRLLLYFAITIGFGIGLGLFGWECAQDVLALGMKNRAVTVSIQKNDTVDSITDKLYDSGLIQHKWLFKLYCKVTDAEKKFDPGVYTLNEQYDYHALVNGMIEYAPTRETVTVMITEGYDCEQIFALLEENNVCSAAELRQAAQYAAFDFWFLDEVSTDTGNRLEGFLYPDTYEFYVQDDATNVLQKILNNFDRKISEYREEITTSGYSVRDIINLAAMIEEEAANNEERAMISSVLYNRLSSDDYLQYLQMDSTVFYACQLLGESFDITIDSPYNTYAYPGLPYGPISNPGLYSIKAALRPAETDYTYFAAGKDGVSHFFTEFDKFEAFVNSDQYIGYTDD